jgi:hypothetical protein
MVSSTQYIRCWTKKHGNNSLRFHHLRICINSQVSIALAKEPALAIAVNKKRSLLCVQTIQHQLPAPIHECRFNHFIIRDACVRLENGSEGSLCWRNGRLPMETRCIERRQFFLKSVILRLEAFSRFHQQHGAIDA